MDQRQAHQGIHRLLGVLQATLRTLGAAPSRSGQALAPRLGVTEAEAAALVVPTAKPPPGRAARGGPAPRRRFPPGGHEGTDRRLERPQDPREQTRDERGTNTYPPVKPVWLSHAARTSRFRSDTDAGRTHDQRRAAATP